MRREGESLTKLTLKEPRPALDLEFGTLFYDVYVWTKIHMEKWGERYV